MTEVQLGAVLRHVRKLAGASSGEGAADGVLLDRFVRRRDEAAFEALLLRHGPLVLGVCRRLLGDETDAADAFQATFLVLVRRAGSVRRADSLGPWLYGVASRVAQKMRRAAARRHTHEGRAAMTARIDCDDRLADDVGPVLDEELSRLPEKYRAALVACYLEGHTHAQAAARLGWPPGSVAKRLARGLELLRERLTGRGLVLSAAGLTALLAGSASAVPPALARTTLRAAALAVAGKALTGAVSAPVVSVVESFMRELLVSRCKFLVPLALGLCVLGAGVAAVGGAPPQADPPAAEQPPPKPMPKPLLDADGDPLPAGALARLGSLHLRHGSPVTSVAWSPDGKLLATGSWDNYARLWDPATGKLVRDIMPGDGWVWAVAFSPDGKFLATSGNQQSKKVRLWDVASGKLVRTFEGHRNGIYGLSYAPDGKTLASSSNDGTVRIWETATGKELRQIASGAEPALRCVVAFSPDGKTLATTGARGKVRLWDAATGKETGTLSAGQAGVVSAAFSKDGKQVIAGAENGNVWVWDVASAKQVHMKRGRPMPALSVAFAPDGKTFAAGYGDWKDNRRDTLAGEIDLWDAASGKMLRRLGKGTAPVQAIAFAPDGQALAGVTLNSSVLLWAPATGKPLVGGKVHQAGVKSAVFLGGRNLVTAGYDHTVRLWDLAKHEQRRVLVSGDAAAGVMAVSADGKRLAWGGLDGKVHLCDATGKEERLLEGHTGTVWSVAFSPDGKRLASGGQDRSIRLWDVATGKELRALEGHDKWVIALAFAPSGRLLASGSVDRSVRLWDPEAGKELHKLDGHTQEVSDVTFSPDGRTLASAGRDDTVRLWETATGRLRWQFGPNTMGRAAVAFSPDGRLLLTGTSDKDRGIRLWDLTTGKELNKVWGHRGFVQALAFAPDGKTAVSVSDDSTVLVWDVAALRGAPAASAAVGAAELETLWTDLGGEDAARAFLARGRLAAAPGQALPLLKEVLRPVSALEPERLARLLKELDDDDFTKREQATTELEKMAGAAEAELRKVLEGKPSAEVRERVKKILGGESGGPSSGRLRQERALEVIELMGTPEAKKLLEALAKGAPQAWLTREARAALDRRGER